MNSMSFVLRTASVVMSIAPCPSPADTPSCLSAAPSAALSAAERDRAGRLSAARRAEFVAGRALMRILLGDILGCPPAQVPIAVTPAGRPEVESPAGSEPLGVSLSHAGGLVAAAVSRHADIGIDIEAATRPLTAVAWSCSEAERAWLTGLPARSRAEGFTRLWTKKEACVKALGTGIRGRLAAIHCGPSRTGRWRDVAWCEVPVAPGFAGAVAVRSAAEELTVRFRSM